MVRPFLICAYRGAASRRFRALATDTLIGDVCERKNLNRAYKLRGSPGVDGIMLARTGGRLAAHKEELVANLLDGSYRSRQWSGTSRSPAAGCARIL